MRGLMVLRPRWKPSERSWLWHSSAALTSHSGESCRFVRTYAVSLFGFAVGKLCAREST